MVHNEFYVLNFYSATNLNVRIEMRFFLARPFSLSMFLQSDREW